MKRSALAITAVLAITAGVAHGGDDDKRRGKDQRELRSLDARARRLPHPASGDEIGAFLASETQRLMKRIRSLPPASYKLRRVMEALDDLLDARQDLLDARSDRNHRDEDKREDTARRLERVYFRVQQGDYFGKLSGEPTASEYVRRSRQLYQQARTAWDRKEYRQAAKLSSASNELINVLENLAQAAVRKPDPPVLR